MARGPSEAGWPTTRYAVSAHSQIIWRVSQGSINPLDIFRRQVRARGIPVGSRESFEAMNRALAVNRLRPVIDRVFPWAEAAAAFRHLENGSPFGKVVLDHIR